MRVSPPPGTSSSESKKDDLFLKLLRDIVGHLLMPQKHNYQEELCVMVRENSASFFGIRVYSECYIIISIQMAAVEDSRFFLPSFHLDINLKHSEVLNS